MKETRFYICCSRRVASLAFRLGNVRASEFDALVRRLEKNRRLLDHLENVHFERAGL